MQQEESHAFIDGAIAGYHFAGSTISNRKPRIEDEKVLKVAAVLQQNLKGCTEQERKDRIAGFMQAYRITRPEEYHG